MLHSNARIPWIPAILIAACFAMTPCCCAEVIQEGTEDFCTLSGYVYHDSNNSGFHDPKEWYIPEVDIVLSGFTYLGDPVSITTSTGNSGFYSFENLVAGIYAIHEIQPETLHTAIANAVGSAGGNAPNANDFTNIQLDPGINATNYNFGELGLKAKYMTKRHFIVVVPEPSVLSMLGVLFGAGGIALYRFRRRRNAS